ncbi:MAG: hypothetical protein JXA00_04615 [Candidatus Thermoplasmatota archaeon]|nr:hypothetical protein [Candidatus Thermoplasmatota archaeon]
MTQITACPNCGSKNIGIGTLGDGIVWGLTSWNEVCRNCGYRGRSLVFDSEDEYQKFLEQLKQSCQQDSTPEASETPSSCDDEAESSDLSKKDKEVIALLKEYEDEKPQAPVWPMDKKWWPEILLAFCLSLVVSLSGLSNLVFFMGEGMALLYGMVNVIFNFVILLVALLIIEYVLYSIRRLMKRRTMY